MIFLHCKDSLSCIIFSLTHQRSLVAVAESTKHRITDFSATVLFSLFCSYYSTGYLKNITKKFRVEI